MSVINLHPHQPIATIRTAMKSLICISLLVALVVAEQVEKQPAEKNHKKRGLFDLGIGGFGDGFALGGHGGALLSSGLGLELGSRFGPDFAHSAPVIGLGQHVNTHTTITRNIAVPVPAPYPVTVERQVPVPVPHPVQVPVDRPYPVHVPRPYPVAVDRPVPVHVDRPIAVPVPVPHAVPVPRPVGVPIPAPYPVRIVRPYPVPVPHPVPIIKHVPVHHHDFHHHH